MALRNRISVKVNERHMPQSGGEIALLDLLKRHRFLEGLPHQAVVELARHARPVTFGRDEIILRTGDPSTSFYLLVSGTACIEVSRPVYTVCIQTLGPGEAFGWSAVLGEPFTVFQVKAREPVQAIELPATVVTALCEADTQVAATFYRKLAELLARRVKALELRLAEFLGSPRQAEPNRQ